MSPLYLGLLTMDLNEDPSELFNHIYSIRQTLNKLAPEQAHWVERRCQFVESKIHDMYTPLAFWIGLAA